MLLPHCTHEVVTAAAGLIILRGGLGPFPATARRRRPSRVAEATQSASDFIPDGKAGGR